MVISVNPEAVNDHLSVAMAKCRKLMDSHGLSHLELRFVDNPDGYGGLYSDPIIYINSARSDEAEDICLHEIAHVLTQDERDTGRDHGPKWAHMAWKLAGKPRGGTPRCPQPKKLDSKAGRLTYRELLHRALQEAEGYGEINESDITISLNGDYPWITDDALRGMTFRFCAAFGDVQIVTATGSFYLNAEDMVKKFDSLYCLLEEGC